MDRVRRPQDMAFDRLVGDVVRELQVLADLARRKVGSDGLGRDLQEVRKLLSRAAVPSLARRATRTCCWRAARVKSLSPAPCRDRT